MIIATKKLVVFVNSKVLKFASDGKGRMQADAGHNHDRSGAGRKRNAGLNRCNSRWFQ